MKFSIDEHKRNLANRESYLSTVERVLFNIQKKYDGQKQIIGLYRAQIELAEKEGKDAFDAERYAIKRLCIGLTALLKMPDEPPIEE